MGGCMQMSKYGTLNKRDFIKGLAITVAGTAGTSIVAILKAGRFPTKEEFSIIAGTAISSGIVYLTANLFTNSNNQFGKREIS